MIIINLQGGLGNQMFQYAFGCILAKKNKTELYLDINTLKNSVKTDGYTPRNFELAIFNNKYKIASNKMIKSFTELSIFNKIRRKVGFKYPTKLIEFSNDFQIKDLAEKPPLYVFGYFQSYKYFTNYEHFIREKFGFNIENLDKFNLEALNKIQNSLSVSVHIRRGDYITDSIINEFHGTCSKEYYVTAINNIEKKLGEVALFFFSDDIGWVRENFNEMENAKFFIDHNVSENCWIDMFLMSQCKHNIIANSSFSWWSAWLNANPDKMVVAPQKWFISSNAVSDDLIPPNWIKI